MSYSLLLFHIIVIIFFTQFIFFTQAGNCFYHRTNDLCYGLSDADTNEEQCIGPYYSDDYLQNLDGYIYADKCRDVDALAKQCDVKCGLGEECRWIKGQEMCVCSEESCASELNQQPLCASNNMTFKSECAFEAWKCLNYRSALYKKYDGECQKDCRNVRCSKDKICLLVKNTGEPICYPRKHCNPTLNPEPVCGTNGVTYPNICALRLTRDRRGRSPDLAHIGSCETECKPDLCQSDEQCIYSKRLRPTCIRCPISDMFLTHSGECSMNIPVCGNDGRLYENYCSLLLAQCDQNKYINIIEYGSCPVRQYKNLRTNKLDYFN